jgi:hypothetical protein
VLGTDKLFAYLDKYGIKLDKQYNDILGRYFALNKERDFFLFTNEII